jgi:hypothetical protein
LFACRENLIRVAFQCLQLVVTDFLPVMPWRCLPLCVDTAAKFGSQTQELNISLTAVGLMVCSNEHSRLEEHRKSIFCFFSLFQLRINSETVTLSMHR